MFMIMYIMISFVILMNLLIAMMATSFILIADNAQKEFIYNKSLVVSLVYNKDRGK
jgi:hypothetical protein